MKQLHIGDCIFNSKVILLIITFSQTSRVIKGVSITIKSKKLWKSEGIS